ncbi:DUF3422 family protein [Aurantimonas sp. MSK8Z-1]|uniref:DUF3422 family protein n=1 Tax=Mangrovibrevibacter kandeliae TaxID=2968473 RepID=UPI0021175ED2|nr:DUF3422 family protein [Aurantimonas sp. MSK8Z-1]MCW4113583.1 DUF3422 family protein [Aurantimonas sp. MSK8Z-1]
MNEISWSGRALASFAADPRRAFALGEIHARPYPLIDPASAVLELAFMSDGDGDIALLTDLALRRGVAPPAENARTFTLNSGKGRLRWERHTEFSTYSWAGPPPERFGMMVEGHPFGADFAAPGPLVAGVHLEIRPQDDRASAALDVFERSSLCVSAVEQGLAQVATDFRQDGDGLTRILVLDDGLTPARVGALAKRLIEIEIYRTLALFGLPLAQEVAPRVRAVEDRFAEITQEMRARSYASRVLLDEITEAAAEVEAASATVLYRFGASRAYGEIVRERLESLAEAPIAGFESWSGFLQRRVGPALRTCRSLEERQIALSEKLARAANLLRTRIDVELEHQNRDLLASMNRRAQVQLRLQQTVEGLSVAAIAYYVVGLFGYVAKGLDHDGASLGSPLMIAGFVPVAILAVWFLVHRIRRSHGEDHPD